jgi:glycosyltransferase involved in cell wall biosynthesis
MKVLVFSSLFPNNANPRHGVFVKERMARFAALTKTEVKVVAPVPYFPPFKWNHRYAFSQVCSHESIDGLDVYHPRYYITPKVGMTLYGCTMFLSALPFVRQLQRRFDFDIIDGHFVYPDGFAAVLLARWFNRPVVITARGSDINRDRHFRSIRRLLRFTLRRANKVIAVSHALKEAITALDVPTEKIVVIPNGVDTDTFRPHPRDIAKSRLGLASKEVVLSVGNLNENKGGEILIKAAKRLVAQLGRTNLLVVLVGDGPCQRKFGRLISSLHLDAHVRLAGAVPHHELPAWYSAADVVCLPSGQEGLPNVLLESLACGTPVVATAVGGIPEVISSDRVGLLVSRNERSLAEALLSALSRTWDRSALVQHVSKWTWDSTARSLEQLLGAVHNNGRGIVQMPVVPDGVASNSR